MEFSRELRNDVLAGDITVSVRLWKQARVKQGGRYRVGLGEIEVDAVELLPFAAITEEDVRLAGESDREALRRRAAHAGPIDEGTLVYRIEFHAVSPVIDTVGEYLRGVAEPKRGTLEALRRTILEIVPEAEEVISYGVPAFRVGGKTVAGFAAFKDHLSYLPFSGSVLEQLADQLDDYTTTKSALHFPVDRPLPKRLVKKLIALRLADTERGAR